MEATGIEAFREFGDFSSPRNLEQAEKDEGGLACELQTLEARYNAEGERVILSVGSKKHFEPPKQKGHESALVLTKFFDTYKQLECTELEIRSPYVKAALKAVVPEFRDTNIRAKKIVLRDQPECLFHYRQELQEYGATLQDPEAVKHLVFVLRHMYKVLQSEIYTYIYNMVETTTMPPRIDFLNLWMIFRPGDHVYVEIEKTERVFEFKSMSRCKCQLPLCLNSGWELHCDYINYDGTDFGYSQTLFEIRPYYGYRSVETLTVVPLQYCQEKSRIRAAMIRNLLLYMGSIIACMKALRNC